MECWKHIDVIRFGTKKKKYQQRVYKIKGLGKDNRTL